MLKLSVLSRSFLLSIALFILPGVAASAAPSVLPLEKGTSWIYEGKVEWTAEDNKIKKKQIQWITRVLEVFNYPGIRVAVVSGLPSDLDWYTDNKPPGYYLLAATSTDAYYLETKDKEDAYRQAREFRHNPQKHLQALNSFISDTDKCENPGIHVKGFNPHGKVKCRQATYRTNPDIQIIDFVYNLGVVHYYYNHFGTVSLVDVTLKEVRFPQKK